MIPQPPGSGQEGIKDTHFFSLAANVRNGGRPFLTTPVIKTTVQPVDGMASIKHWTTPQCEALLRKPAGTGGLCERGRQPTAIEPAGLVADVFEILGKDVSIQWQFLLVMFIYGAQNPGSQRRLTRHQAGPCRAA